MTYEYGVKETPKLPASQCYSVIVDISLFYKSVSLSNSLSFIYPALRPSSQCLCGLSIHVESEELAFKFASHFINKLLTNGFIYFFIEIV